MSSFKKNSISKTFSKQFPMITKIKKDCLKKIQNGPEISCAGDQKRVMFSEKLNALSNGEKRFAIANDLK